MGVGCTLEACGVGCVTVFGVLGDGCVKRSCFIHLFLYIAGEDQSLDVGKGTSLAVGVAWAGLAAGDWSPLQVCMAH